MTFRRDGKSSVHKVLPCKVTDFVTEYAGMITKKHKFFRLLPAFCSKCLRGDITHRADGLCENCYMAKRRKEKKETLSTKKR